ncbi:MAG TPA: hypothetical protein VMR52_08610 [Dehalococcoidia bacterium]|nr:hypothetical protein [Dehalococcoidia bacterium]
MRALVVAVVLALALGLTVKDMATDSAASPGDAWESRAMTFDESMGVSETGTAMRE